MAAPTGRFFFAFFAVAAVMAPVSIRTYAVVGGDVNSFSHSIYFLLLGTILAAADLSFRQDLMTYGRGTRLMDDRRRASFARFRHAYEI